MSAAGYDQSSFLCILWFYVLHFPSLFGNCTDSELKLTCKPGLSQDVLFFLTIPISLWGIVQHMVNYTKPELQRRIVRIIWMVPIYATDSWLALRFPKAAIYLDSLRECYEAYVIYNFMTFLLAYLNTEYDFEERLSHKPQVDHFFPCCILPPWKMGRTLINRCKQGALSYTVIRILTTAIAFCTELADKYHEGDLSFKSAWSYIVVINNCSQVVCIYFREGSNFAYYT